MGTAPRPPSVPGSADPVTIHIRRLTVRDGCSGCTGESRWEESAGADTQLATEAIRSALSLGRPPVARKCVSAAHLRVVLFVVNPSTLTVFFAVDTFLLVASDLTVFACAGFETIDARLTGFGFGQFTVGH